MAVPEGGNPVRVSGRRIVGALFEQIIDVLALYLCYSAVGIKIATGQLDRLTPATLNQKLPIVYTLYLVYLVTTKVITLGLFGWTPGMLITSVRCVKINGRAPGIPRALLRTAVFQIGMLAGLILSLFFYGLNPFVTLDYFVMTSNRSRKALQDMAAGTFVIDSLYMGHLLLHEPNGGVIVGPVSMTRAEAERELRRQGAAPASTDFQMPTQPGAKSGEPFLDKNLDTYVVWNETYSAWLAFDKASGGWVQIG